MLSTCERVRGAHLPHKRAGVQSQSPTGGEAFARLSTALIKQVCRELGKATHYNMKAAAREVERAAHFNRPSSISDCIVDTLLAYAKNDGRNFTSDVNSSRGRRMVQITSCSPVERTEQRVQQ